MARKSVRSPCMFVMTTVYSLKGVPVPFAVHHYHQTDETNANSLKKRHKRLPVWLEYLTKHLKRISMTFSLSLLPTSNWGYVLFHSVVMGSGACCWNNVISYDLQLIGSDLKICCSLSLISQLSGCSVKVFFLFSDVFDAYKRIRECLIIWCSSDLVDGSSIKIPRLRAADSHKLPEVLLYSNWFNKTFQCSIVGDVN